MKRILILAIFVLVAMTACTPVEENVNYKELVLGEWDVQTYRNIYHDFTDGQTEDESFDVTDPDYVGYDAAGFNADGSMWWHMNDLYLDLSMHTDPYRDFNYRMNGDSLIIYAGSPDNVWWNFVIKELDNETMVVEGYNADHQPLYNHHEWEEFEYYTFKRATKKDL